MDLDILFLLIPSPTLVVALAGVTSAHEPSPQHSIFFKKKWVLLGLFFVYFRISKQTLQFLQQMNVKNVHAVYGAWIRTCDLWNTSLLP